MNDVFIEEVNPEDPNQVKWQDGWEPLRIVREEIPVKGEAPRTVEMKFSRHGPIFFEDTENHRAYAVRSITHDPGTAPYLGSLRQAQAESCDEFFERAMFWKVPTHNLICGDSEGNIASKFRRSHRTETAGTEGYRFRVLGSTNGADTEAISRASSIRSGAGSDRQTTTPIRRTTRGRRSCFIPREAWSSRGLHGCASF